MMFELFLIQVLCVLLIDVAGVPEDFLTPIVKRLTGAKIGTIGKPFSCSLCMTFWTGLVYLLVTGNFTLVNFTVLLVLACLTPVTLLVWHFAVDLFTKMISTVYDYFNL